MENMDFCQSCAMPMEHKAELKGTNADGSQNEDYCVYCYKDGAFTDNYTMEDMIEACVPHVLSGNPGMTEEAARQSMRTFIPTLKRWNAAHS